MRSATDAISTNPVRSAWRISLVDPSSRSVAPVMADSGLKVALPRSFNQNLIPEIAFDRSLEPCTTKRCRDQAAPLALGAVRLPKRKPRALVMQYDARPYDRRRAIDDAAYGRIGWEGPGDYRARVDGFDDHTVEGTAVFLEVPPGNAVLGRDKCGPGPKQLPETGRDLRQGVRLQTDENDVCAFDNPPVVRHRRPRLEVAALRHYPYPVLAHLVQVLTSGDQRHVGAAAMESGANEGADGTRAEDDELHEPLPVNVLPILARWTFPVGVRGIVSSTKICFGSLNWASRSAHQARSAASSISALSTTAAPTTSP